jgi:membrane-bound serine protease (ClpP class)
MPFAVALLCHPAGAYAVLITAVAGLVYASTTRTFVPAFTGVSATLLTVLAYLQIPPNSLGLLLLGLGVALLHAEFLLPTFGLAGVLGVGVTAWASTLLLAPSAAPAMTGPLALFVALAGTLVLVVIVARTMRLRALPRC